MGDISNRLAGGFHKDKLLEAVEWVEFRRVAEDIIEAHEG